MTDWLELNMPLSQSHVVLDLSQPDRPLAAGEKVKRSTRGCTGAAAFLEQLSV